MRSSLSNLFLLISVVLFLFAVYCRFENPVTDYMDMLFFALGASGVSCALSAGNSRLHIHQVYPKAKS